MWRVPAPLIAGSGDINVTIDTETYIGDLYTYLGSPAGVRDITLTIDGVDVGEIIIPSSFAVGCTFEFIAINGGRILGVGGNGGDGGDDLGATGTAGSGGGNGGHAITNQGAFAVSVNVDDGYLLGGGGGGGGGGYTDTGTGGDAGSGGGGGQGWTGGTGGTGGSYTGLPAPGNGAAGSRSAAGSGGSGGSTTSDGGPGGTWGLGGQSGRSSNILQGIGANGQFQYYGGLGGEAGRAYSGTAVTLSGTDSEATLRAANRIMGEIGPDYLNAPNFSFLFFGSENAPVTTETMGISFETTGSTLEVNTTTTPTSSTQYYLTGGSGTGADYQVRARGLTGDIDGAFDAAVTDGTWVGLSSVQTWSWDFTASGSRAALFEMRRSDIPGTTTTSDEVMISFFVKVAFEEVF